MDKYDGLICSMLSSTDGVCIEDNAEIIDEFIDRATHHGVLPLLHHVLSSDDEWKDCPASFQKSLSDTRKHSVAISMMREQFLASLFSVLSQANIIPALLKGEALAHTHYASPDLRVRCDTDVLIPVSGITKTIQVLESDGFSISSARSRYKSHQFTASKSMIKDVSFQVDVHWRISNDQAYARLFSYEACVDQSEVIDVAGQECRVLDPSHVLILTCVHLSVQPDELADRLIWLYDVHLLVSGMSEARFMETAQLAMQKGVGSPLLSAIEKTQQCFDTSLPQDVIDLLGSSTEIEAGYDQSYLALVLADIKELPCLSQKWALVCELLFPGSPWLLNKYNKTNSAWVPLLYMRYLGEGLFKRLMLK